MGWANVWTVNVKPHNQADVASNVLPTNCAICSAPFPIHPKGYCGGSGYAIAPDNRKICHPCADKEQIESLKDRSKPVVAYVGKGDVITTWTGGKLMTITRAWPCQLTRRSNWHDAKSYLSIHAVDVHGGHWAGRGSEGVAIKLRPVKS